MTGNVGFFEILFPTNIAYGSSGGAPGYLTHVVSTQAGFEYRNGVWTRARGKWNVAHGLKQPTDYQTLLAFFHAVGGRANGFRFLDWLDHTDGGTGVVAVNAAGFNQLAKVYTVTSVTGPVNPTYTRFIDKPVPGTVVVTGGGSVDYTSGLVSGANTGATWTGQFHVPVRFDVDELDMSIDQPYGASDSHGNTADVSPSWRNIPIIEIRMPAPVPPNGRVSQAVFEVLRTKSFGVGPGRVSQTAFEVLRSRGVSSNSGRASQIVYEVLRTKSSIPANGRVSQRVFEVLRTR